jgi:hypothetical protein
MSLSRCSLKLSSIFCITASVNFPAALCVDRKTTTTINARRTRVNMSNIVLYCVSYTHYMTEPCKPNVEYSG